MRHDLELVKLGKTCPNGTLALTLSDRVVVMNRGRAEQVSTPNELYTRPQSAFVARFIGCSIMGWTPEAVALLWAPRRRPCSPRRPQQPYGLTAACIAALVGT